MAAVRTLEVLVVGAGLAGLALCVGLRRLGARIDLVELASGPDDAGAGLLLTGNGLRVLDAFGLGAQARAAGRRVDAVCFADASGAELFRLPLGAPWPDFVSLHRARLRRILLDAARPVVPRWGVRIADLEAAANGVDVVLSDGERRRFDLVVGADGVHSALRQALFGAAGAATIEGFAGWRCVVPGPVALPEPIHLLGNGRTLLLHPLADGEIYCGAGPVCGAGRVGRTGQGSERESLLGAFSDFGGIARSVLDAIDDSTRLIPTSYWEVVLERWRTERCVLVGDAAHASAPTLAQGASMAFEDVAVLCEELGRDGDVPAALERYEVRRRPRVLAVQRASRERMEANRPLDARAQAVRDQVLRRFGRQQLHAAWGRWMETAP